MSPHSSDSLYTLKMKSGIKKVRKSADEDELSPFLFLSLSRRLPFPFLQHATRLR